MKRGLVLQLAIAFATSAVSSTGAHHSHPIFYDACRSITVDGRIESVRWVDPHTIIVVRLDDQSAYTIDWNGLKALTNNGVIGPAQGALVPGARVAVTGNPIRSSAEIRQLSPDYTGEVNPNTIDPTLIRRADGSWSWARTPSDRMPGSLPPSCADATRK